MSHTEQPKNRSNKPRTLYASELYDSWYKRVGSGEPNDYIVAISANPRQTGVTGTGKTTLALRLAKTYFDASEDGFDASEQSTVDPQELAQDLYPNASPGSTLIYDEAQGTNESTGLNSKRAMKDESLNAINNIATRRNERKALVIVTQNIKSLVGDLYDYIDSWLLIQNEFDYWATHYRVHPDVFNFETRQTETPGVEDITWDPFLKSDSDYQYLQKIKEESKQTDDEEEDTELPLEVQAELAVAYRDAQDLAWRKVSEASERLTYSGEYLRQEANDMGLVE